MPSLLNLKPLDRRLPKKWSAPLLFLLLACCADNPQASSEKPTLEPASFEDLVGWRSDQINKAAVSFAQSCNLILHKGLGENIGFNSLAKDWRPACEALKLALPQLQENSEAARHYFETWFQPFAVNGPDGADGLFTGYYEIEFKGSRHKSKVYQTPLYERPRDLVEFTVQDFKPALEDTKFVGKIVGHHFVPYDDRSSIVGGSLRHRAHVLFWAADPVDVFFLEIQGSGRIQLPNGKIVHVGFDGSNGRSYTAIGRCLADRGELKRPISMQKIRAYLDDHPLEAPLSLDFNASYVFFRILTEKGPVGAEGVVLTPERSLAVDPHALPLGVPVWLETVDGTGAQFTHLLVAQDTGGAIKGPVRGDVFWGAGEKAEAKAGPMQSRGRYYVLLPRDLPKNP